MTEVRVLTGHCSLRLTWSWDMSKGSSPNAYRMKFSVTNVRLEVESNLNKCFISNHYCFPLILSSCQSGPLPSLEHYLNILTSLPFPLPVCVYLSCPPHRNSVEMPPAPISPLPSPASVDASWGHLLSFTSHALMVPPAHSGHYRNLSCLLLFLPFENGRRGEWSFFGTFLRWSY